MTGDADGLEGVLEYLRFDIVGRIGKFRWSCVSQATRWCNRQTQIDQWRMKSGGLGCFGRW